MLKRSISLLLALVLLLALAPTPKVHADDDYWVTCYLCLEDSKPDERCDDCLICDNCHDISHCSVCDACYIDISDFCEAGNGFCPDCEMCMDCAMQEGYHCYDCGECYGDNLDGLCGECFRCEACTTLFCPDCGWCDECSQHCPECGECFPEMCEQGGEHCKTCEEENDWICPDCEECIEAKGQEVCPYCGLCEDCCLENGCDDCGLCVEDSDYEFHLCEECGECLESKDVCDECGLCMDCCRTLAEGMGCQCGEYCWTEIEEDHFCADCGDCFGMVDPCDSCYDADDYRCEDCCLLLSQMRGCDCLDPVCTNDVDWDDHFLENHTQPDGEHDPAPDAAWSRDNLYHWHDCRWCEDSDHITGRSGHTYNAKGVCVTCGFSKNTAVYIVSQTKAIYAGATDPDAPEDDPDYPANNLVTLKVQAYGIDGQNNLHYAWYITGDDHSTGTKIVKGKVGFYYLDGETTSHMTISVNGDACYSDYWFYCVVTDDYGHSIKSAHIPLRVRHSYVPTTKTPPIHSQGHYYKCIGEGCTELELHPHIYDGWKYRENSTGTLKYRTCTVCGYEDFIIQHEHVYDWDAVIGADAYLVKDGSKDDVWEFYYLTEEGHEVHYGSNKLQHWIQCSHRNCTLTSDDLHNFDEFHVIAYPTPTGTGAWDRVCSACGFIDNRVPKDRDNKPIDFAWHTHLIYTTDCTVNVPLVKEDDTFTLKPVRQEGKYPTTISAVVEVTITTGGKSTTKTVELPVTTVTPGREFRVTVPKSQTTSQGPITTTLEYGANPIICTTVYSDTPCTHGATELKRETEPTCDKVGYTGDQVCSYCGTIVERGAEIPEKGHGELVPVTESVYVTDSHGNPALDKRGYYIYLKHAPTTVYCEGNYSGLPTDEHERGCYTGDLECTVCGQVVEKGRYSGKEHDLWTLEEWKAKLGNSAYQTLVSKYGVRPYVSPNHGVDGYSGDSICTGETCTHIQWGKTISVKYYRRIEVKVTSLPTAGKPIPYGISYDTEGLEEIGLYWETESGERFYPYTDDVYSINWPEERVRLVVEFHILPEYWVDGYENPDPLEPGKRTVPNVRAFFNGIPAESCYGYANTDENRLHYGELVLTSRYLSKEDVIPETCGGDPELCPLTPFTDAPKYGNWAHEGIEFVVRRGLMGGTSATTFAPKTPMSRAMLVTVLYRMEGEPGAGSSTFTDVPAGKWFSAAISWAADNGIVTGTGGGSFNPNGNVTREQLATILYRYAGYKHYKVSNMDDLSGFADSSKVGKWFVDGMKWAVAEGLINGSAKDGKTWLTPQGEATREQVATILMRFVKNYQR